MMCILETTVILKDFYKRGRLMSLKESVSHILQVTKKAWIHGGIQWRKEFLERGIQPDKFLELPNSKELLTRYAALDKQQRVMLLNTLHRRYPFLRF